MTCPRRHKWSETVLAPVYRYFPPSREPAAPDTIASLRGWHGFQIGATGAQYSLKYRVGVSRPGTSRPNLYSRPGRTVPRDVRPWQDVASARARARELAPKIHAARRRVIAHHEAGHLIVAAHLGVLIDQVSVEVARRFSIGAVHLEPKSRGRPQLALATILAAGGEAERKLTGAEPQGIEADEAALARMSPYAVRTGRARARVMVKRLWPYIEELAKVLADADNGSVSGETATFVALLAVHGKDEARARMSRPGHPRFDDLSKALREP